MGYRPGMWGCMNFRQQVKKTQARIIWTKQVGKLSTTDVTLIIQLLYHCSNHFFVFQVASAVGEACNNLNHLVAY